ncbi:hypothetical protein OG758_28470 [Streptomyces sp. NBC_01474]|uniref:hypothetical protein n=1 Tax=unclassified Streptomyces TaxID=2593676 RepID=UPI002DD94240|nr:MULTISPECIES: hypothetical protein [unclassified Streptomyces]WSD97740.1 hypothetical protein OG758_28470 [Streptomyces sp. NBC_01474]
MSEMLFHRLDAEEHAARELVARLRAEIAETEERLAALAITRRTAAQLLEEVPPKKPTASGGSAESSRRVHARSSTDGASEPAESDPDRQPGPQRHRTDERQVSKPSGQLTELNRKVVTVVGSADRPLSPKDVVIPLVDKSAPRAEIERMRHRLNRLVDKGYLKQVGPGLYIGAEVDQ